jgi:sterol desaturase/sphingolipid hydroxylase (fatty acid hydroxylase superfamily)
MINEFQLGRGKISAVLSLFMGAMALAGVTCFHFPEFFTTPELRAMYPITFFRILINIFIYLGVGFGTLSLILGYRLRAPFIGITLCLISSLFGGGQVEVKDFSDYQFSIALDWFLLDLLILAVMFIPLEKMFHLKDEQKLFRQAFKTDLIYFFLNHVLFQVLLYLSAIPAKGIETLGFGWPYKATITDLPFLFQLFTAFFIIDLFQYAAHRSFHQVSWLWKFHAVHHSVKELDWIGGSRLHLVDVLITRAIVFIPLHQAGFRQDVLEVYILIAAFQTVFIHANLRWKLTKLTRFVSTPFFHHWHHASDKEALDKNFAVHLPVIDMIFGTYFNPKDRWPKNYGLYKEEMPRSFWLQFLYPFKR